MSGPTTCFEGKTTLDAQSRTYRVVVTTSEIYNRVYIEEITSGDEGCCAKIVSVREINLEQLYRRFGSHAFSMFGRERIRSSRKASRDGVRLTSYLTALYLVW
ncbi:MAG: hypothetical protein V1897_10095 [Pseudomonadota bacterium]